jgi:hypothetical protein
MEQKQSKVRIDENGKPICEAYPFTECKYFNAGSYYPQNNLCVTYYAGECLNALAIVKAKERKKENDKKNQ